MNQMSEVVKQIEDVKKYIIRIGLITDKANRNFRIVRGAIERAVFNMNVEKELKELDRHLEYQKIVGVSLPIVKTRGISLAAIEVNIKSKDKRACENG